MRIPSASTDRKMYFVAVDATDLKTRETGLSGFTVYRSRDGGAATVYTTPTVAELSAANMPGVYCLTIDEDTTIAAGHDTEEYCVHITHASMAPVTRTIDIERVKFTEGQSATMANNAVDADVERWTGNAVATTSVAGVPEVDVTHFNGVAGTFAAGRPEVNTSHVAGTAQTAGDIIGDTNDIQTRLPAALVGGRMDSSTGAMAANVVTAASIAAAALNGKGDWNIGKTGYALSAAGVQAIWDALTTALTTVGSIGKRLADNIDAAISSRLATASYTAPDNASIATILTRTDVATSTRAAPGDAMTLTAAGRQAVADAILARGIAGGADGGRTVGQALAVLRNKVEIAAGTLTVYNTDDVTPLFTAAVATAAGNPISSIDPV